MLYTSEKAYIESATTLKGKIAKIDAIIVALEDMSLSSAANMDTESYQLDDGQSKIQRNYRDIGSIITAIGNYEKLKQMYIGRLNGNIFRLVPANSITNYN